MNDIVASNAPPETKDKRISMNKETMVQDSL
jgi:hypothetical protein